VVWAVVPDTERYPQRITVLEPPYDDNGTRRATRAYVSEGWPAQPTERMNRAVSSATTSGRLSGTQWP
jgi:hypothetical protein